MFLALCLNEFEVLKARSCGRPIKEQLEYNRNSETNICELFFVCLRGKVWPQNGITEGREVFKKLPGGVTLHSD